MSRSSNGLLPASSSLSLKIIVDELFMNLAVTLKFRISFFGHDAFLILGVKSIGLESGSFAAEGARRIPLGAGNADAGRAACVFRDARQQFGLELGPTAPAGRLLMAGGALHFHGALVRLPAQRAQHGING